jgi:hypothetical protein
MTNFEIGRSLRGSIVAFDVSYTYSMYSHPKTILGNQCYQRKEQMMSEEKRLTAEAEATPEEVTAEQVTAAPSAPSNEVLPAAEAHSAAVTPVPAPLPVEKAALGSAPMAELQAATVPGPIPAAENAAPARRRFQPEPDTGKKIGPFSASMWILVFGIIAIVFVLLQMLF